VLTTLGQVALRHAGNPFTNVYGLARTALAVGTAGTMLFTKAADLFPSPTGIATGMADCAAPLARWSAFCVLPAYSLDTIRLVAVVVLIVVATGFRPRLTGIPHWWISFSFMTSAPVSVIEGGDHVAGVLTLLLVPVTLNDNRRWHWSPSEGAVHASTTGEAIARLIAWTSLFAIRLQVAGIYFQSAVAKLFVYEWREGSALYYWFNQPIFPTPDWAKALAAQPFLGRAATWGTIALELALCLGLVAPRFVRSRLLVVGVLFHVMIAGLFGLLSFGFAMAGALVMFLRPLDKPFRFRAGARKQGARLESAPAVAS
jgi:antimicrobial peptide system SdpB family protein